MSPLLQDFIWMLVFLVASAFFSGMETGLVSINHVRLRHMLKRRDRRARRLQRQVENPESFLATTLVGTNIANIALTLIAARFFLTLFQEPTLANLSSGLIMTVVILIFGEYLPKAWFQSHPLLRCARFSLLFDGFSFIFRPVNSILIRLVRLVVPMPKEEKEEQDGQRITRKDVQFLLSRESGATPDLSEQRRRMIYGVFELSEKKARDVMVPREEMRMVRTDTPFDEVLELARKVRVKSLPVYSDEQKRFTGILKLTDLFERLDDPELSWPDLMRPPLYVDADTPADDLLPRLRLSRQSLLLIRDEHNRVIGFVTTEVVLEEIVGPLYET